MNGFPTNAGWAGRMRPLLAAAALLAFAGYARAAAVVGEFDWNDGTLQGWENDESWVTLSHSPSGGVDNSGFMKIALAPTTIEQPDEWFALVRTPASNLLAGAWNDSMWVEFDFWAEDVQPNYVQVHWASATGAVWRGSAFDAEDSTMRTQTWTHLSSLRLENATDWNAQGRSQEQFVTDLANINWIGIFVSRFGAGPQDYGVDNFRLMTPEPSQTLMVLSTLVGAALTLRKRRRQADPPAGHT